MLKLLMHLGLLVAKFTAICAMIVFSECYARQIELKEVLPQEDSLPSNVPSVTPGSVPPELPIAPEIIQPSLELPSKQDIAPDQLEENATNSDDPESLEESPQGKDEPESLEESPQDKDDPESLEEGPQGKDDPASQEKGPQGKDTPEVQEKSPQGADTPESQEKSPQGADTPESQEKSPQGADTPESQEKGPLDSLNPEAQEKSSQDADLYENNLLERPSDSWIGMGGGVGLIPRFAKVVQIFYQFNPYFMADFVTENGSYLAKDYFSERNRNVFAIRTFSNLLSSDVTAGNQLFFSFGISRDSYFTKKIVELDRKGSVTREQILLKFGSLEIETNIGVFYNFGWWYLDSKILGVSKSVGLRKLTFLNSENYEKSVVDEERKLMKKNSDFISLHFLKTTLGISCNF